MRRRVVQGAGVKQVPHHDLAAFKAAFARDKGITVSARRSALDLGMGLADVAAAIARLDPAHFYKYMVSYNDRRHWQDVYHLPHGSLIIYVKFIDDTLTEFLLLSFKEK